MILCFVSDKCGLPDRVGGTFPSISTAFNCCCVALQLKQACDFLVACLMRIFLSLLVTVPLWGEVVQAAPAGIVINNTATLSYEVGTTVKTIYSNPTQLITEFTSTQARMRAYRYDPTGELLHVGPSYYQASNRSFMLLPAPEVLASDTPLDLNQPQPMQESKVYHSGDTLFIVLEDADQNLASMMQEVVQVKFESENGEDIETLRLTETEANSGVFSAYISLSTVLPKLADGVMSVDHNSRLTISYIDTNDSSSNVISLPLVMNPVGLVFNSRSGLPIDGVSVTLVNAVTGLPAEVRGSDGESQYPSTVISGSNVTDSAGTEYQQLAGQYRFPVLPPGEYRLEVTPTTGYLFPSEQTDIQIQALSNVSFNVNQGSRGENVVVTAEGVPAIDIPLDANTSGVLLSKYVNRNLVAAGEFLQYRLRLDSETLELPITGVMLLDDLPQGFRLKEGSVKLNGEVFIDPVSYGDGRHLRFDLGTLAAGSVSELSYVVEVMATAPSGDAVNTAWVTGDYDFRSNEAKVSVKVNSAFFNSEAFLTGRVLADGCDIDAAEGVENVRLFLENGTYVVTDEEGRWHIEGVEPGTHVLQLDRDTLLGDLEAVACEESPRFAGTPWSQFVDVQAGSLWRADFYLRQKQAVTSHVSQELSVQREGDLLLYRLQLQGAAIDLSKLRVMISLAKDVAYQAGSSMLDNKLMEDPGVVEDLLMYQLGLLGANEQATLSFILKLPPEHDGPVELQAISVLNTVDKSNQRIPMVTTLLRAGEQQQISGISQLEIKHPVAIKELVVKPDEKKKKIADWRLFDSVWLAAQNPGFEWVYPAENFNPAIDFLYVGIKHNTGQSVSLRVNGSPVRPLSYDGMDASPDGSVKLSRWRGVGLSLGDNLLEAVLVDAEGNELKRISRQVHYSDVPVEAEIIPELSQLVADGTRELVIAVRFTDRHGYPARHGVRGEYSVGEPYLSAQSIDDAKGVGLSRVANSPQYLIEDDGLAYLRLQPTTVSGELLINFDLDNKRRNESRVWLQSADREWVFVGLAEGGVGKRSINGNVNSAAYVGMQEGTYNDNRVAFYTKGKIKGKWLLTAAYDTKKSTDERFKQIIDPNTYYTLYGDNSVQQYDAASKRKLYIKIEREKFYALFGDYDTGLSMTELGRYERSFTGFKSDYQDDHWRINAFGAETEQVFFRDEIQGDGTSGLYQLKGNDILENSEEIIIETRDRLRSEVVVTTQKMLRHIDYNIDYESGTVYFRQPVLSRDQAANPNFIIARYESSGDGEGNYTAGGRVAYKPVVGSEVGLTVIHEDSGSHNAGLLALDARVKLSESWELKAEIAASEREALDEGLGEESEAKAYLLKLEHRNGKLDTQFYMRQAESDFGLGQQNVGELGQRKIGVDSQFFVSESQTVNTEIYRHVHLDNSLSRDVLNTTFDYSKGVNSHYIGARVAQEHQLNNEKLSSSQLLLGASTAVLDKRLKLHVDSELLLQKTRQSADSYFPDRFLFGADYMLNKKVDLLVAQEYRWNDERSASSTLIGLRARPWLGAELSGSTEQRSVENSDRLFANIGLLQAWHISPVLRADFTLDRSQMLSDSAAGGTDMDDPYKDGEDFNAESLALGYYTDAQEWLGRLEHRNSASQRKFNVFAGYLRELGAGLAMSVGFAGSHSAGSAETKDVHLDVRYSFVYRPENSPWTIFNRLDYLHDKQVNSATSLRNRRLVNNAIANFKPNHKDQLSLQYGAKFVLDTIDGEDYQAYSDLYGVEYRRNLSARWDVGFHGNALNAWRSNTRAYAYGLSVGVSPVKDTWVSLGYNVKGFSDEDFSAAKYTAKGFYVKFRFKFDQQSLRNLWSNNSGQLNENNK